MSEHQNNGRTHFISFSGIDGAGKSTQIEALCSHLQQAGLQVRVVRFWDDIATLKSFRESAGHTIFKGDKGVGSPSRPINRKDKNVRSWPMSVVRFFIYSLDAISTRQAVKRALRSGNDLVIFDRYVYDELANLTLSNPIARLYARLVMKFVPRPQISYLLDANPEMARARKPEYPLEFLHMNRRAYMTLVSLVGGITVVEPLPIPEVTRLIIGQTLRELSFQMPDRDNGVIPPSIGRPTPAKVIEESAC